MFRSKIRYCFERGLIAFWKASAGLGILVTVSILFILLSQSIQFFKQVSFREFLFDTQWTPLFADKHFGILPLLTGTLLTSSIAMLTALPLGLLAAIYLSEFASRRSRIIVKPLLEILSGIPTIVYGYFALVFLTPVLQKIVPELAGFNALSPGIMMGIMIIPLICSLSEDALFAVPRDLREASYALGATRVNTIIRIVIPAALSGIKASVILAVSRAIGETMIVTLAAGQQPNFTLDPRVPIETMTTYIVQVSMGDTPRGTLEYQSIFIVGATLFVLTLAMNFWLNTTKRGMK